MSERLQKLIAQSGLCSRRKAEELLTAGRVTVDGAVASLGDKADPLVQTIAVDGVFLAVGLMPENEPFAQLASLNGWGYFDSQEDCRTATEGLFVAGDCRSKRIRQVVTASSDGAVAAMAACAYLD